MAATTLLIALAGCGHSTASAPVSASSLTASPSGPAAYTLVSPGTLTVCSSSPYPPFEITDKSAPDHIAGFDIDLITAIAGRLGLGVTVINDDFATIAQGAPLADSTCDVIASALPITAARRSRMLFSAPYDTALLALLAPVPGPANAKALAGAKIAVERGTSAEQQAAGLGFRAVTFPDDIDEIAALSAGDAAGILEDLPTALTHTATGDYQILQTYPTDEQYGFAVALGNTALVQAIDAALAWTHTTGEYARLSQQYFGLS